MVKNLYRLLNNLISVVDDGILNENPTPLEIKQSLAQLKLNGINKKKESEPNQTQINHDSSDQENQKPTQNGTNKKMVGSEFKNCKVY